MQQENKEPKFVLSEGFELYLDAVLNKFFDYDESLSKVVLV